MTRFEFGGSRRSLWKREADCRYIPAPNFGAAMPRRRFGALFKNITFSEQPINRGDVLTSAQYRWTLVSDFLDAINEHRVRRVSPSELICVDESMVRWYGPGGHWIDVGLPHYVAMNRKPEAGCEIQNACCAKSGIMLRLELVTTAEDEGKRQFEGTMNHGTAVLKRLLAPWYNTRRHVVADSYFASVEAAAHLSACGLFLTGVVKTATRRFPMSYLSFVVLPGRGAHTALISNLDECQEEGKKVLAFCWVDRNRRYFVTTASSVAPGNDFVRQRWRQGDNGAERVQVTVKQPRVVETYYSAASAIDMHNRCRLDDLGIERKVEVKDWHKRVNFSLFSICIVDAWMLYKGSRGAMSHIQQHAFHSQLAEELIDNNFDQGRTRRSASNSYNSDGSPGGGSEATSGRNEHLTPTKKRRIVEGKPSNSVAQNRCHQCGTIKSKFICSGCKDESVREVYFCHSQTERICYTRHLSEVHFCD